MHQKRKKKVVLFVSGDNKATPTLLCCLPLSKAERPISSPFDPPRASSPDRPPSPLPPPLRLTSLPSLCAHLSSLLLLFLPLDDSARELPMSAVCCSFASHGRRKKKKSKFPCCLLAPLVVLTTTLFVSSQRRDVKRTQKTGLQDNYDFSYPLTRSLD